jgi:hypothetical protein
MLTLQMLVFAAYADSMSLPEREEWANYFPDGQHFLGMLLIAGWMNGLLVAVIAVGIRRFIRRERLFQFTKV